MRRIKNIASVAVIAVLGMVTVLVLTGQLHVEWGGKPEGHPAGEHGDGEHERHEGESKVVGGKIMLDEESWKVSGIRTAAAAKGSVARRLRLTGEVQISEERIAHVTPRIPGVIREIHKAVGDEVADGTPLCTIESVELGEARAAYVTARSERTLTERNYNRWKELFEKGLKTQNEFWAAENEFTRAKLHLEAATAKLKALGFSAEEIAELDKDGSHTLTNRYLAKSPLKGSVLQRHATLGENVEAKDEMFLVADLSEVWVMAAVYEKDLSHVRHGMSGSICLSAFPSVTFKGRVTYVGQQVNEKTRTVPVRLTVKNEPVPGSKEPFALRPGMFATVELETSRKSDVLVVPAAAVQTLGGEAVVFVQTAAPKGHEEHAHEQGKTAAVAFERRDVVTGERDSGLVEILKGLAPGDPVVVENAFLLKSEFEKSKIGEGHAH